MSTTRKMYGGIYTEVKRIVDGEVKQTCCCCKAPGATPKECAVATGESYNANVIRSRPGISKECRGFFVFGIIRLIQRSVSYGPILAGSSR